MSRTAFDGWAITRIPPAAPMYWPVRRAAMSLISVSDVDLGEDIVLCTRQDALGDWGSPLKL